MKALTIFQPYAELIACGEKRVENRTRPISYRGLIYIHAGKSKEWLDINFVDPTRGPHCRAGRYVDELDFGAVIAIAKLIDCLRSRDIETGKYDEQYPWLRAHTHMHGPWCWILDGVARIGPWPWKGAQGLFDIDEDELDRMVNRELGIKEPAEIV